MRPRVLHVLETCGAGGIETTLLNVLRCWQQQPWADHRVLAFAGGALASGFREAGAQLTIAGDENDAAECLFGEHDVVYFLFDRIAHQWLPAVAGGSAAAIVYGKGYDLAGTLRLGGARGWQPDESLMWGCEQVTFTTDALAATYRVPRGRFRVLGKAADVGHFDSLPLPADDTPDRIVCVANLHALKRLGDLVRAAAILRPAHPTLRLRFVGGDASGEGERLAQLAGALGVADICEWVGRRDDVAADLAASRIFALPSSREGVPTAMLEAMSAARPVVVTDVGHVSRVLRDGVDGHLVPVGDVEMMACRLGALLTDRARARAMGLAGRDRAAAHGVPAVAARLRAALERAIESAAGRTVLA